MAEPLSEVWELTDHINRWTMYLSPAEKARMWANSAPGYSLKRLPLATPEHAALVEAAMKFYRCVGQQLAEPFPLFESATFCEMMDVMRRIYHGHPLPTVKESLTDDAARAARGKEP